MKEGEANQLLSDCCHLKYSIIHFLAHIASGMKAFYDKIPILLIQGSLVSASRCAT